MKRRKLALLLSVLLPGLGHVVLGRCLFGVLLAFFYALCLELLLVKTFVWPFELASSYIWGCGGLAAAIWAGALGWVIVLTRVEVSAPEERREELLKEGMKLLLEEELASAEEKLRELVHLEPEDVEAYLYLGSVYEAQGEPKLARNCFKTCLNLDRKRYWKEFLDSHLKELRAAISNRSG